MRLAPFFLRELARHRSFALLFTLLLGLGLAGFLLVGSLRDSVARSLEEQSRALLGADLAVSVRRQFTEEERARLEAALGDRPFTLTEEFFSMLSRGPASRLVLVKAVDSAYPLFGQLRFDPAGPEGPAGAALGAGAPVLAVSPETLAQLGASVGEALSLGGAPFRVASSIAEDPTQSFRAFAIGGRAYVHRRFLEGTGLLQAGSTVTYSYLVLCRSEADAAALQKELRALLPSTEIRVSSAKEAGESAARALGYLGDFLGLVSLIALLLSAVGAAYLYRFYLAKRQREIAIFRALGVPQRTIELGALAEIWLLALLSLVPAYLLAASLAPLLGALIGQWSQAKFALEIRPVSLLLPAVLCLVGAPCLLLPELLSLRRVSPLSLFREAEREGARGSIWQLLPAMLLFAALAPFVANSFRTAGIFLGLLAALSGVLLLVLSASRWLPRLAAGRWTTRHAFLLLARRRRSAAVVFLTLSLGSLLLHLLPQLEASLRAEMEAPTRLPSLFLFDIQPEQKEALEAKLSGAGFRLSAVSPLVRARILSVNGKPFERAAEEARGFRTREDEQEERSRNRGVNLSFRAALQESELLERGSPLSPRWDPASGNLPELSVEARFAKRLGLAIGDVLRFDIQGAEVDGRIVNLRRVRWTSFQPNFFLVFQDGVLNDAPLTYLANLPALSREEKVRVQELLALDFPNVSVVDVAATIERVLSVLERMRLALALLAGLGLLAGLSVLASVLSLEARERARSLILFRALGASEGDLRRVLLTEGLVLCALAVGLGAAGSVAFTFGLSLFLFDGAFRAAWVSLVGLSVLLVVVGLAVSWLATRALVRRPPLEVLRDGG